MRRVGALLLPIVLLAGCSASFVARFPKTEAALERDGYVGASVRHLEDDRGDVVVLAYRGSPDPALERRRAERAARIVWETLVFRFDELELRVAGSPYSKGEIGYSYAGLSALFGGRGDAFQPEMHTAGGVRHVWSELGHAARAGVVAAVVLGIGFVAGSAVWLRRRAGREG